MELQMKIFGIHNPLTSVHPVSMNINNSILQRKSYGVVTILIQSLEELLLWGQLITTSGATPLPKASWTKPPVACMIISYLLNSSWNRKLTDLEKIIPWHRQSNFSSLVHHQENKNEDASIHHRLLAKPIPANVRSLWCRRERETEGQDIDRVGKRDQTFVSENKFHMIKSDEENPIAQLLPGKSPCWSALVKIDRTVLSSFTCLIPTNSKLWRLLSCSK